MSIQAVAWVLDHSQSRGLARLVLISLANHANDSNECWPSQRTIAAEAGISLGAVSTQIKTLVELGELKIVKQGTHRRSTVYEIQRSSPELSVQPWSEQNHQEEEALSNKASSFGSSNELGVQFADFHAKRAVEAVDKRRRNGLKVKSRVGLAKTIAQDPDFIEESKRIWEHRDCARCKGKGEIEEYSPGAGMTAVECNA